MKKPILKCFHVSIATGLKQTFAVFATLLFTAIWLSVVPFTVFAKVPVITYSNPKIYITGVTIPPLAPTRGGVASPAYTNTAIIASRFPNGAEYGKSTISVDKAGNVFTGIYYGNQIIETPAGGGSAIILATLAAPVLGVVVDQTGNIYAGINNGTITEIPAGGGTPVTIGTITQFASPDVLAVDVAGNLYAGGVNIITKIPANGSPLINSQSGAQDPTAIAIAPTGDIYVVDGYNTAIYKILVAGGSPVTIPNSINFVPHGIAIDKNNNMFLSGRGGGGFYTVQLIPAGGTVPILISNSISGNQQPGGNINDILHSLALDGSDNIFVANSYNNTVEEVRSFGTYSITPALPAGLNFDNTSAIISGIPVVSNPATNYTVTAYTSSGSGSAVVNIKVLSNNANLANLGISSGMLTPGFTSAITSYNASVNGPITSITVTPTVSDAGASVMVNGTPVASGAPSPPIILNAGLNTITTIVTAQDGTTKTYTIKLNRDVSTNANLTSLKLSSGTLTPAFAIPVTSYTATVPNQTTSVTITPVSNNSDAVIRVNGTIVAQATASASIPLAAGANTIATQVTAPDGVTKKTYTVVITRLPSTNANLTSLKLSSGILSPVFDIGTPNYTALVPNSTTSVTITPVSNNSDAVIRVNGTIVAQATASASIPLAVGANTIATQVTAPDGVTKKTYTVIITRLPSNNANLISLKLSSGTLSPAFAIGTVSYTADELKAISAVTVTPLSNNSAATIKVNGITVISGNPSKSIPLAFGPNTITTVVTAQDGVTAKTYTVTVTRDSVTKSNNSSLAGLTISSGSLSPVFSGGTMNYTASAANATASVTVTPVTADPTATVKVNGAAVASGTASPALPLTFSPNTLSILITAQDGTTTTYTVVVTRLPSANANLTSLKLSSGTLSPVFAIGTPNYTASVPNSTTSVTVTPVSNNNMAVIKVNGAIVGSNTASQPVPLVVGPNVITTLVNAQDGKTTKTYTITVTRTASGNSSLASLTLNQGNLPFAFNSYITNYTDSLAYSPKESIIITPTAADPEATVTVDGTNVINGSNVQVGLAVGSNTITIVVTASNATKTTYILLIIMGPPSHDANLSNLTLSNGTLSPAFASEITNYTVMVDNSVSMIYINPITENQYATATVPPYTPGFYNPITLTPGENDIYISVTAEDGTTVKVYSIKVIRAFSTISTLSSIGINGVQLSPSFNSGVTNYTASVPYADSSVLVSLITSDTTATLNMSGFSYVTLSLGINKLQVVVTAGDGKTTTTYTILITRVPPATADLSGLTLSSGSLSPVFDSGTTSYTASVSYATTSITVTPTLSASNANATIQVNGITVPSGSASASIPLRVGRDTITTLVTAHDGVTTKKYTVIVTRVSASASNDANLAGISVSPGTISPVFSNAITAYTATIPYYSSLVVVNAILDDHYNATNTVNGIPGMVATIPVMVGPNNINVVVTAQDQVTKKTYTINVTRLSQAQQPDDYLTGLSLSSGTTTPAFTSSQFTYNATVDSLTSITVTPTAIDGNAKIKVNGVAVLSGTASQNITLTPGSNYLDITVKAQNGIDSTQYVVGIKNNTSSNAHLSELECSGTLSPTFSPLINDYYVAVGPRVDYIYFGPVKSDSLATLEVFQGSGPLITGPIGIPLQVGQNEISFLVVAQDGVTTDQYNVNINVPADTLELTRKNIRAPADTVADGLLVHPALSPNGDGINDYLIIDKITDYPDNTLKIMDRNGTLVFEGSGYDNASRVFDGHSSKTGTMQLPGTYFYSLQYKAGNKSKYKTGYLVIKY